MTSDPFVAHADSHISPDYFLLDNGICSWYLDIISESCTLTGGCGMATKSTQAKRKINIELSGITIGKLDRLARKVDSSRAELIRRLISESLAEKEEEEIKLAMKEGYVANYGFIRESSEEWDFTSGDGL